MGIEESKIVLLSPFVERNAVGHWEVYHQALFRPISEQFPKSEFWGKEGDRRPQWFKSLVPVRLASPVPSVSLPFLRRLRQEALEASSTKLFFVYEGNIIWALAMALALRGTGHRAVVNLFDTENFRRLVESQAGRCGLNFAFRTINLASRGNVLLAANTPRFLAYMREMTTAKLQYFPEYTAFYEELRKVPRPSQKLAGGDCGRVALVFRGDYSMAFLSDLLSSSCPTCRYVLRGLSRENAAQITRFENVEIDAGHLDDADYVAHIASFKRFIFLYSPEIFRFQMSAKILDALCAGAPVAVPAGTALADIVERLGNGFVFDISDRASIGNAVGHFVATPPSGENLIDVSPAAAVNFFKRTLDATSQQSPRPGEVFLATVSLVGCSVLIFIAMLRWLVWGASNRARRLLEKRKHRNF